MASKKYVYFFGGGKAEGKGSMKELLGGKGAGLAEMTNIGLPVPAGFTITTEVCDLYYRNNKKCPPGLEAEGAKNIARLEGLAKKTNNRRFTLDAYRRFIVMYGAIAMGVSREEFEHEFEKIKNTRTRTRLNKTNNKILDTDVNEQELQDLISLLRAVYKRHTKKD